MLAGFLNTVEEKNQSSNLTLPNDDSLLNSVKHLPSLTGNEAWFNNEVVDSFPSIELLFGKFSSLCSILFSFLWSYSCKTFRRHDG